LVKRRTAQKGAREGKYSVFDNFTQRICRSVTLTSYSITHFGGNVKGFVGFLLKTANDFSLQPYRGRKFRTENEQTMQFAQKLGWGFVQSCFLRQT
jgi:hypothetical protein